MISNVIGKWEWKLNSQKIFTSASVKSIVSGNMFTQMNGNYESNCWLPIKANFLYWRVPLNRIPTRVSLAKRRVPIGSLLCPVCNIFDEDNQHIFAFCSFARSIWTQLGVWLKLPIIPSSLQNVLMDTTQFGFKIGTRKQKIWIRCLK